MDSTEQIGSIMTYRAKAFLGFVFSGFTLAELLIALGILGVIATFSIPKVLMAQQSTAYNADAKDMAAAFSGAFQQLRLDGSLSTSTTLGDLKPYLNYVSVYSGSIDDTYTDTQIPCGSTYECLEMHNGGVVAYRTAVSFGGTATTNALPFFFDPDGKVTDGTTNGPGKSVTFFIYYNSRIADRGNIPAGTANSSTSYGAAPGKIPPWFSWN